MRWFSSLAGLALLLPASISLTQESLCNPCVDPLLRKLPVIYAGDREDDILELGSSLPCQSLDEYDEIVSAVTEYFFDRTFNGLDWDTRVLEYRSEIRCGTDSERLASVVNALLSELNASHTALYTQSDQHYWGLNSFFWRANAHLGQQSGDAYQVNFSGIWAERLGAVWYARFVMEDSPASRAGVRVGDSLISIDGTAFEPLEFGPGTSTLVVSSDGRLQRELSLKTTFQSIALGFENATRESAYILEESGKRIGHVHLWAGGGATLNIFNEVLRGFAVERLDALLIDMRGGYGGMGEDFLGELRTNPVLREIPKYFLIDNSLRSGKELVAGVIKRDGLGILVGSRTAGQYLAGRRVPLFDDKYFLYVATGDGPAPVVPGIGKIESNGIEPDVQVEPCRMYCSGYDPQFEEAIQLIVG